MAVTIADMLEVRVNIKHHVVMIISSNTQIARVMLDLYSFRSSLPVKSEILS